MKWITTTVTLIAWTVLFAGTNDAISGRHDLAITPLSDSVHNRVTLASYVTSEIIRHRPEYSLKDIDLVLHENKVSRFSMGKSQQGRTIDAFYFPGTSKQRALVIAGVHGSELSSLEIVQELMKQLSRGHLPYYSVIVIQSLFPDNAINAMNETLDIGSPANIGRYTRPSAVDPNRQMPSPGKAYDERTKQDHLGRTIEAENQFLLELIQSFKPQRVINVHAIRNTDFGGIYADPRTDNQGIALGYSSDSSLAVCIANYIHRQGGNVAGNKLDKKPTALYYKDPTPVPAGLFQKRNMTGSLLNANRGSGVSLGTWGSTAIANENDPSKNREAMRIITMEYPGCKRPFDYRLASDQLFQQKQVELFALAIRTIFLGNYFTENNTRDLARK